MLKAFFIPGAFLFLMTACNVRNQDKLASSTSASDITKTDSLGANVTNTSAGQSDAAPTTVQIIDSVYNFGKVLEGEIVEFSFRFKNVGTNPLIVSSASASCGCTVPEKPEAPVMPGEMGFIKAKFDTKARAGAAHKTITILSNATPAFPTLVLKGDVTAKPSE